DRADAAVAADRRAGGHDGVFDLRRAGEAVFAFRDDRVFVFAGFRDVQFAAAAGRAHAAARFQARSFFSFFTGEFRRHHFALYVGAAAGGRFDLGFWRVADIPVDARRRGVEMPCIAGIAGIGTEEAGLAPEDG